MSIKLPQYIAHRGLSMKAPENTFAAFEYAEKAGYQMFECDVQLTADYVPIIIHDESLKRTTNGKGRVHKTHYTIIQSLDAGSWFVPGFKGEPVPTLAALLNWLSQHSINMNLELKGIDGQTERNRKLAEIVAAMLKPYLAVLEDRILISSFQYEALVTFKALCPEFPLSILLDRKQFKKLGFTRVRDRFKNLDALTLNPALELMTQANIPEFLKITPNLLVYTVELADAEDLFKQGVLGVFTNG